MKRLPLLPLLSLLSLSVARAGDTPEPAAEPAWRNECSSCHMAYPPGMLAADTWRRLMTDLSHHFGTDASLDAAVRERIAAYLSDHAARDRPSDYSADTLRITDTEWFVDKHLRKAARLWLSGKVRSPADCKACHRGGDENSW